MAGLLAMNLDTVNIKHGVNVLDYVGNYDTEAVVPITAATVLITKKGRVNGATIEGEMPNNAGDTAAASAHMGPTTTIHIVPAVGFYDGSDNAATTDLTTLDANHAAEKIKKGVTSLGLLGTYNDIEFTAGNNSQWNNPNSTLTLFLTYQFWTSIRVKKAATYRVFFSIAATAANNAAYGKIYKNGGAIGTERIKAGAGYEEFSEDIAFAVNDRIQIYFKTDDGDHYAYVSNFKVCTAEPTLFIDE